MIQVEKLAAEAILEKGVRVALPAPFLLRVLFVREVGFIIKQPTMGQLFRVSSLSVKTGFDLSGLESGGINEAHRLVTNHCKSLTLILAALMIRGKWRSKLFSRLLAWWMLWRLTPRKLAEIALVCVAMSGIEDFTTTIRLIGTMRITAPKNLSRDVQGS